MSTPAVTRPGRPRARFALSRRWRRPVVAGLLIAVSLVLAPEQLAHGTGHLVAAGLMLAAGPGIRSLDQLPFSKKAKVAK